MATIKKDGGYMPLPINIKRGNPIPLDASSIWYNVEAMADYAKNNITAYVGQILVYVDEEAGDSFAYVITNLAGDLKLIGEGAGGDAINVDNNTIVLNDNGLLTLKDYGVKYYKYVAEVVDETTGEVTSPATYVLQEVDADHPWRAGLIPQVVADPDKANNFIIGWYEPNPTTVDGINAQVSALDNEVKALSKNLNDNYYTKDQIKTEFSSVLKYQGSRATEDEIKAIESPNKGDVYVALDTGIEYIYDGNKWDALGNTLDLSSYATVELVTNSVGTLREELNVQKTKVATLESDTATLKSKQTQILEKQEVLTTKIGTLETLLGAPGTDEAEASGLFADFAILNNKFNSLNYLEGITVDGTDVPVSARKAQLLSYSGEGPGLVPARHASIEESKAEGYVLSARGTWVVPFDPRIGNLTYNGEEYSDVTSYVDARVENVTIAWETITST